MPNRTKPHVTYTYVPGPDLEEDARAEDEVYRLIFEEAGVIEKKGERL